MTYRVASAVGTAAMWAALVGIATATSGAETKPAAAGGQAPMRAEDYSAKNILSKAVEITKAYKTVSADLTQHIDMLEYRFDARGTYMRSGEDRWRLEVTYTVRAGSVEFDHSRLIVCDGKTVWRRERMPGDPAAPNPELKALRYEKIDLETVRKTLENVKKTLREVEPPQAIRVVMRRQGLGGMFMMLEGLEQFADLKVVAMPTIGQGASKGHWVLSGPISQKTLERILGPAGDRGRGPTPERLPAHMPQHCKVTINAETWWPERVELTGRANPTPERKEPYSMVLDYTNVQLDKPIPDEAFAFAVPQEDKQVLAGQKEEEFIKDQTDQTIQQLVGEARQVVRDRAERAKRQAGQEAPSATTLPRSGSPDQAEP